MKFFRLVICLPECMEENQSYGPMLYLYRNCLWDVCEQVAAMQLFPHAALLDKNLFLS